MRANAIREIWANGGCAVNAWASSASPMAAEVLAHAGFDSVTVDLQHGLSDYAAAVGMITAINTTETVPLARVPWLEPGIVMKLLDAGALGLICPMVNSPAEAEAFVSACRYAPAGRRSFGPTRAVFTYGADYPDRANETIVTLAMIETLPALESVDAICRTPGLDAVYIGPADLALSLGRRPGFDPDDPDVVAAIERILDAANGAGIKAAIHCGSPAFARAMIARGFSMVTVGSDLRFIAMGAKSAVEATRAS